MRNEEWNLNVEILIPKVNSKSFIDDYLQKLGIKYHKILFSCSTNEEIAELIITNDYEGIFYISTSYFGKIKARKTGSKIEILEKDMTIPEFSNSIETLEEDCYVFHIRQLIAGVNVKGLCSLQYYQRYI